jgi:hypothetical protein
MPLYWFCYRHNNQIKVVIAWRFDPSRSNASGPRRVGGGYLHRGPRTRWADREASPQGDDREEANAERGEEVVGQARLRLSTPPLQGQARHQPAFAVCSSTRSRKICRLRIVVSAAPSGNWLSASRSTIRTSSKFSRKPSLAGYRFADLTQ